MPRSRACHRPAGTGGGARGGLGRPAPVGPAGPGPSTGLGLGFDRICSDRSTQSSKPPAQTRNDTDRYRRKRADPAALPSGPRPAVAPAAGDDRIRGRRAGPESVLCSWREPRPAAGSLPWPCSARRHAQTPSPVALLSALTRAMLSRARGAGLQARSRLRAMQPNSRWNTRASWRADALEICEGGICALVICEGYVRLRSTAAGNQCAEVAIQFRQARQIGFIFAMLRSRELEDRSSLTNNLL